MIKKFRVLGLAVALVLVMVLAACGGGDSEEGSDNDSGDNGSDGGDGNGGVELGESDLELTYVSWAGALVRTPLIQELLEEIGYDVEATQVEGGAMWTSVAQDDASFMTASWLPVTHQEYQEQYDDDTEEIGVFVEKAPLSMTVPSYMEDVNSIEDLKDNEELGEALDWTITGIDPGAGVMNSTENALEEYGLDNWELQSSSEAGMLSELQSKIQNEEPIIVTGWRPHSMFSEFDLKMLEDPKEVYGGEGDRIGAVAHTSFEEDSPAAYEFIQRFTEDYDEEMETELLVAVNDGATEEEAASQFIEDNPDLVEKWTEGLGE
ncbi:glycine betaine ABC transporter substrate-binding protein [Virgibacillus sp. NKC19-3]|uniref:glycine betaine ABC transporter substrate-binding protein n=1 Tax=Virgibacillus saliphilus TaxID=2831674 RepID=UPI001C9AF613|nr:glycine betaine ABC transporter substrate-binding protein [Virgibacillus sp. NKC19-3]MBY7143043.1 glycine betaine ABC transporter substrate-binding protein [Virgibacillus sp. NKC19-3]